MNHSAGNYTKWFVCVFSCSNHQPLLFFPYFSFLFPSILTKQLDFVEQKKKKKKTGSSFYCYFFVGPFHQDKNKSHARI